MSFSSKNASSTLKTITWLALIAGIGFRLFHYFYNRSLWIDEVYLSSSIIRMDYMDLVQKPLDYQQKAPIGFLWTVKFIVNLLGKNEMALRLFSLIGGICSLFIMMPVARYFLKPAGTFIAIAILAFAPPFIFHSVEIKQYQTELLATLLCLYLYIRYNQKTGIRPLLTWGFWGAVIIWFSYSSIFILAGIALGLSLYYLIKKKGRLFGLYLIPFSLWMLSFLLNYFLFTHKHTESKWIVYWFSAYDNFMPFPPHSVHDLKWFFINFYRVLDYPLGLLWDFVTVSSVPVPIFKMPFVPIVFICLGVYVFVTGNKKHLLIWIFSFGMLFLVSGLKLYPLTERFWVFVSPLIIFILASGFDWVYYRLTGRVWHVILLLLLIAGPFIQSLFYVIRPAEFFMHKKSFQREALLYINQHFRPGDAVYIYWNDLPGYRLYKTMYNLKFTAVEGKDVRNISSDYTSYYRNLQPDLDKLQHKKRVWLMYNNYYLTDIGDKIDDPAWYYMKPGTPVTHLFQHFSSLGTVSDSFKSFDVWIYLFET